MGTTLLTGLLVLGLLACSPVAANENADTDRSPAHRRTQQTLVAGTLILATTRDSLSSRRNRAGETVTALVSGDVEGAHGRVVIPAGSPVALRIVQLEPAANGNRRNGKIALDVTSLTVRGQEYPVSIRVEPPHWLLGRGGTAGEVETVSGGTVIGVVTAAIRRVSRDVVVPPGTAILFVLPQPLTVTTR